MHTIFVGSRAEVNTVLTQFNEVFFIWNDITVLHRNEYSLIMTGKKNRDSYRLQDLIRAASRGRFLS